MTFRDDLDAAHARIAALEGENAELRAQLARATGRAAVGAPPPVVRPIADDGAWLASRIVGWAPPWLAYAGEVGDRPVLRLVRLGDDRATDHLLGHPAELVARLGGRLVAQLADGVLIAAPWPPRPDGEVTSLQLPGQLRAPPREVDGRIACLTDDQVVHWIDPAAWCIRESRRWSANELPLQAEAPDSCRLPVSIGRRQVGWAATLAGYEEWSVRGALPATRDRVFVALSREIAGRSDMMLALARVPRWSSELEPVWITPPVPGDVIALYTVDGVVVTRSVFGLDVRNVTLAVDPVTGAERFRVVDALRDARLHLADGTVFAV